MKRDAETILDELLILRWQGGDARAFEMLVGRHQKRILHLAYLRVGQREAAADIVQEVWASAIRTIRRVRDPAKFRSWIDQIVRNKSVDWIRRNQRRRDMLNRLRDEQPSGGSVANSTFGETDADDRAAALQRLKDALAGLGSEQRELLSRLYLDGKSVQDIALELEIPAGTVKSRLYHARESLRRAYERSET